MQQLVYNRLNINSYLGFDQYRFTEDHYRALSGADTAWDYTFFPELTGSILEQLEDDAPLFSLLRVLPGPRALRRL